MMMKHFGAAAAAVVGRKQDWIGAEKLPAKETCSFATKKNYLGGNLFIWNNKKLSWKESDVCNKKLPWKKSVLLLKKNSTKETCFATTNYLGGNIFFCKQTLPKKPVFCYKKAILEEICLFAITKNYLGRNLMFATRNYLERNLFFC